MKDDLRKECWKPMEDPINPAHYKNHPSGVECIQIAQHFDYNLGNVIKYVWRCGRKGKRLEDLQKARWYLDQEITRLTMSQIVPQSTSTNSR